MENAGTGPARTVAPISLSPRGWRGGWGALSLRDVRAVLRGADPLAHTENVTRFDGERHLRLVAEQMLRERPGTSLFPVDARLVAAGAALVAVGALTPDAARAIANAHAPTPQRRDLARPPLAPDAAWISVLDERVDLTGEPPAIQSWAEQVEEGDAARHHLWERVATRNDFHDPRAALEAAIAALAAVGALPANDPVIGDVRLAAALMYPGSALKDTLAAADALSMPVPWRSVLARWGQADGPAGSILVGKVSAPFDGVKVAVTAIDSRPELFSIGVEVVPGLRTGLPYRALDDLRHITWWAADDQGNYSLGEQGSWTPGASRAQGSLGFWPGLDPRAAWVDLMPTTASARAVIRVPLPWATAPPPLCATRPPRRRPEIGLPTWFGIPVARPRG
jgi:hypothetical protein